MRFFPGTWIRSGGALAVAILLGSPASGFCALTLAHQGQSDYRIVLSTEASAADKLAASELQSFLKQISGAELPVVTDDVPATAKEILLGRNARLREFVPSTDFAKLAEDGFILRTVGERLLIVGGRERGTLYGVYAFLEEYLGCRWYSSKVSRIPKRPRIVIESIDATQVPAFKFREVFYRDAMNSEFAARLRLNGTTNVEPDDRRWGTWCHSLYDFVPPEKHFEAHPEYFSLVNGQRIHKYQFYTVELSGQLCFSRPELEDVMAASLRERMRKKPNANCWSISQMDSPVFCECDRCSALNEREGSPMATTLEFVNRLAKRFPDQTLSTLAYTFTIKPPRTLRPASNVCVVVTTTGATCERPIAESPDSGRDWPDGNNAKFRRHLQEWSDQGGQLLIWDYVIGFSQLLAPFPNLRVLQPNLKLYLARNAAGAFMQGNREVGGEFCELRAYLLAKLLWNPHADADLIIDDFLSGYYGAAALPIRRYIDLLHDALATSEVCLTGQDSLARHQKSFLAPELLLRYQALFDEAERLVAGEPELLERVQTARMPVLYAQVELKYGDTATRERCAEKLYQYAERAGIQMISEIELTSAKYYARLRQSLANERQNTPAPTAPAPSPSRHRFGIPGAGATAEVTLSAPRRVAWLPVGEALSARWRAPRLARWPARDWVVLLREQADPSGAPDTAARCFVSSDQGVTWRTGDPSSLGDGFSATYLTHFPDGECLGIRPVPAALFSGYERSMQAVGDVPVYGKVKFYEMAGAGREFSELPIVRYRPGSDGWTQEKATLDVPTRLLLRRDEWLERPWFEARPVLTGSGELVVADHRVPVRLADRSVPKRPPVVLFSSPDRGRTWKSEGVIVDDKSRLFTHVTLGRTPAGGLLCLLRANQDDKPGPLYATRRPPAGGPWSELEVFEPDALWPTLLPMAKGVTALVLSRGQELCLRLSQDPDCRVWSDPIPLNGDAERLRGPIRSRAASVFASVESIDPQRLLMVYGDLHPDEPNQPPREAIVARELTLTAPQGP